MFSAMAILASLVVNDLRKSCRLAAPPASARHRAEIPVYVDGAADRGQGRPVGEIGVVAPMRFQHRMCQTIDIDPAAEAGDQHVVRQRSSSCAWSKDTPN